MYDKLIERLEFVRDNWEAIAKLESNADYHEFLIRSGHWNYTSALGMCLSAGLCSNLLGDYLDLDIRKAMLLDFKEQCPEHASSKRAAWFYPVKARHSKKGAQWDYDNMSNFARNPHRLELVNFAIQYLKKRLDYLQVHLCK